MKLKHARGTLDLDRCRVMGILNRTPDSFYDGGRMSLDESVRHALLMVEEGADILDLGAVKAGPGAAVSEEEETDRLVPLVDAIAGATDVAISIETSRPSVARRAIAAGAGLVNDVSGLADPGLVEVCAETGAALILMHHGGQIRGRPRHPTYADVISEVRSKLEAMAETARTGGVAEDSIVIDPGLDFGKNTFHSLELMRRLPELVDLGLPVLVAASRKDIVGETLGLPPPERLEGSLALAVLSAHAGAAMVRVHDVAATARAVAMTDAVAGRVHPTAPVRGLWD